MEAITETVEGGVVMVFLHCEEECLYYNKENNTCQSKKCATGGDGTVTLSDRIFCEPWRGDEDGH